MSVSRFGVCLDAQSTAGCSCSHTGHNVVITIFYTFSVFIFRNVCLSAICEFPRSFLLLMFNFILLWQENMRYIAFVLN